MVALSRRRDTRTRGDPLIVGLERDAKLVVEYPQIAVAAAHDRGRHDCLDFLSNDTDIRFVAAIIAEAIEAETVIETAEQVDVVLQGNIRAPSAAASAPASTSSPPSPPPKPPANAPAAAPQCRPRLRRTGRLAIPRGAGRLLRSGDWRRRKAGFRRSVDCSR